LRLFDACRIVATDLSPNLLRILEAQMRRLSLAERVCCVATDAMKDFFLPSRFDIVTGASILHHLIDPEQALRSAYRVLKPQGTAFFFEPFEGCALVRVAFTLILDSAPRMAPSLDERVSALLVAMIEDFRVRTGSDKSAELYRHLDDKWLFTRRYFEQAARRIGFRSLTIIPQSALDTQYRDFVASLLRVTGLTDIGMPDWAWRIVDTFDGALSTEMRWDVPLEGIIVLTKD
jgi:ubiquinone/menaquinone biosynthesis C-methylase UbiE